MDTATLVWVLVLLLAGGTLGFLLGRRTGGGGARTAAEQAEALQVTALLAPAADALVRVEGQLREIEKDRVSSYAMLREQVAGLQRTSQELQQQTSSLAGALRSPQIRGRWGELQLQRVVELAGMTEHCDFQTQVSLTDVDGTSRPDLVVRLSGGRSIPVDSKVPFAAWLEALDAGESPDTPRLLAAHARAFRAHVDHLASKAYWRHFQPAPEFVVMFVPGEPLLDAALRHDPQLAEYALSRNVILATPTTLVTLLRTIAFGWRQERMGENAARILELGRDLHGRLATMGGHLAKLGSTLNRTVEAYNTAVASVESRVLVSARRLSEHGVGSAPIPSLVQLETHARTPQAPEFELDPTR